MRFVEQEYFGSGEFPDAIDVQRELAGARFPAGGEDRQVAQAVRAGQHAASGGHTVRFGAYPFGIGGQLAERFHAVVSFDRRPVFKYAPARRGDRVVESFVERRILPADHHRVQESRRFQSAHEPDRFVLLRRAHVPQRSAVRVVVPFVQVDLRLGIAAFVQIPACVYGHLQ